MVSSTNKTDRHYITEIFLKVGLNTINQPNQVNILSQFSNFKKYLFQWCFYCVFEWRLTDHILIVDRMIDIEVFVHVFKVIEQSYRADKIQLYQHQFRLLPS